MSALTIRNLPEETHRVLRARAAQRGRSTEAEILEILELSVRPAGRVKLGSLLAAIGREAGIMDQDVDLLQSLRDKTAVVPVSFD